ncbi:MAG TPA: class I SAM-dependent methyltransferase [Ktedonobacterales bacterium]
MLARIFGVEGRAILEVGAGNGYFAPLLLRRFSGQRPARVVISDQSQTQLDIAQAEFRAEGVEYLRLDVRDAYPFPDATFDLILAIMLFNELTATEMRAALGEARRALTPSGQLLMAVTHPDFVHALGRKDALTDFGHGLAAMPGAEGLRLPVSRRPKQVYLDALRERGFSAEAEDIFADERTRHERPGLKLPRDTPLALVLDCRAVS